MWQEKYRPKTIDCYFGNRRNVRIVKNWLRTVVQGTPMEEGLLFHGPPGTGKTSLTQSLEGEYDISFVHSNASDKRKKEDIQKLIMKGSSRGLSSKKSIVILDETEGIKTKYLHKIIENTHPILITNEKYEINRSVRNRLIDLEFETPSKKAKIKYIKHILKEEDEKLDGKVIRYIAQKSRTFRATAKNTQLVCATGTTDFFDDKTDFGMFEEVSRMFQGKDVGRADMEPRDILKWALDNEGNPAIISALDRLLGQTPPTDYRSWRYVYDLVQYTNANPDVDYPRLFKLLAKYRGENK